MGWTDWWGGVGHGGGMLWGGGEGGEGRLGGGKGGRQKGIIMVMDHLYSL